MKHWDITKMLVICPCRNYSVNVPETKCLEYDKEQVVGQECLKY